MSSLCVCDLCHNYFPKVDRNTHKGNVKHGTIVICSYCNGVFDEVAIGSSEETESIELRNIARIEWESFPPETSSNASLLTQWYVADSKIDRCQVM